MVSKRVGRLSLRGTVSICPAITTRWACPRLVRAITASPSRMTSRCEHPARLFSIASAIAASLPETDSMSQRWRVISMEDADRSSGAVRGICRAYLKHAVEKRAGPRILRVIEYERGIAALDHHTCIHEHDSVGGAAGEAHFVRYHHHCRSRVGKLAH